MPFLSLGLCGGVNWTGDVKVIGVVGEGIVCWCVSIW